VIITRPIRLPVDATAVDALDRTFTTTTAYEVRRRPGTDGVPASVELVGPVAIPPRTKRYEMTPREGGLVARRGGVTVGYARVEYAEWNRRAEIGDFYVAATARRSGVGAALMAAVVRRAHGTPARCLWLETQDINGPAIAFYLRQGFALCGFDDTLYDPATHPGETALFFSCPL
jgi:ribosomal protein S18 acetylase RimI-like enzyme